MFKVFSRALLFFAISVSTIVGAIETGPAGSVYRVPSGGGRATMGKVDFSSANAISGLTTGACMFGASTAALLQPSTSDCFWGSSAKTLSLGTASPDASAIFQLDTTSRGFLPPRMTSTQVGNISSPAEGLVVYDSTNHLLNFHNGSSWKAIPDTATKDQSYEITNLSLVASVSGNALTIAVKDKLGNDPSSTSKIYVGFRDTTSGTGDYSIVEISSALSLTVSSGSTLGHTSGANESIFVYLINNSGTAELGVSTSRFSENDIVTSTTAEGGAGGADSRTTLYTTAGRTNKAIRIIGQLRINEATAGTYATAPAIVTVKPFDTVMPLGTICSYYVDGSAAATTPATLSNPSCTDGNNTTWISSGTHASTGLWAFTFTTGWWGNTPPKCWGTPEYGASTSFSGIGIDNVTPVSTTQVSVRNKNGSGTNINEIYTLYCMKVGY